MTLLLALRNWDVEVWRERFRKLLPDLEVVVLGEPFDRRSVHYAVAWHHPPRSLAGLPNLAAILSPGAGVDHVLADPDCPQVPIFRVVDPDLTARMSEYVVLHCLLYLRGLPYYRECQRRHEWLPQNDAPSAADVRVGLLGYGVLGHDAATKLHVMGFDVAGWSRTAKPAADIPMFAGEEQLSAFLSRTDILVCLLPLTEATRGILNIKLFSGLAQNGRLGAPVLINAGRGGLQSEADILEALNTGVLGAATLDVFQQEPLPSDSALWDHPNVIITPHNAADSNPETIATWIAEQIRILRRNEIPGGLVNADQGY